jgi:hypothetical protein
LNVAAADFLPEGLDGFRALRELPLELPGSEQDFN